MCSIVIYDDTRVHKVVVLMRSDAQKQAEKNFYDRNKEKRKNKPKNQAQNVTLIKVISRN